MDWELGVNGCKLLPLEWIRNEILGVPIVAQWLTNPTRNHEPKNAAASGSWRRGRDQELGLIRHNLE